MEGLVLFNKPSGYSSNQIVEFFKKRTGEKVGHGGTLDPLASGLLIIGIGEYTKKLTDFLKNSIKVYIAEIKLGYVSDTFDKEGRIKKIEETIPSLNEILNTISLFKGKIKQKPPIYSAIKLKGIPAYKLARKGREMELPEKEVFIHEINFIDYNENENILKIKLKVGSGFYVRSFANDLGQKLGCGAYLENLIRTEINNFKLEEAISFEDIEKDYLECYIKVYGKVQGVGFRFFTSKVARKYNLLGYAKNLSDGTVEVVVQGKEQGIQDLIKEIKTGPILAKVEKLDIIFRKPLNIFYNFEIL